MKPRRQDDSLREVLEALTRLRLSHDRRRECREAEPRDAASGSPQGRETHAVAPARDGAEAVGSGTPRGSAALVDAQGGAAESAVLPEGAPAARIPFYVADVRPPTAAFPAAPGGRDPLAGWSAPGLRAEPPQAASPPTLWDAPPPGVAPLAADDPPWLDEAGPEPGLAGLVGADTATAENAHGTRGEYLRRDVVVETRLPHLRGLARALAEALPETAALTGMARDVDLLAGARPEDLVFLDLETTGLHRGIIVLLGYMTVGPGERPLTVSQLFPRDYDEEAYLLGEFIEVLRGDPVLVTFNGRSFDAPYLENRLRFHGWFEPLNFAHVDLLHLARRLWKGRLPNYRLQTLERRVFGRRRLADLPGSEVPRVWEDFVNYGELRHLPGIWEHNLRDLATLAEIIVRAARDAWLCETSDEDGDDHSSLDP